MRLFASNSGSSMHAFSTLLTSILPGHASATGKAMHSGSIHHSKVAHVSLGKKIAFISDHALPLELVNIVHLFQASDHS
jgi:hypothetical protein